MNKGFFKTWLECMAISCVSIYCAFFIFYGAIKNAYAPWHELIAYFLAMVSLMVNAILFTDFKVKEFRKRLNEVEKRMEAK